MYVVHRLYDAKEFYVCCAHSRAALTPSNVHRTFLVRLYRFRLVIGEKINFIADCYF